MLERLTETPGGQLPYEFRRPWADGPITLLLTPLERLVRLPFFNALTESERGEVIDAVASFRG